MKYEIAKTYYTGPELNLVSINFEGFICLSVEVEVDPYENEGEEEFEL